MTSGGIAQVVLPVYYSGAALRLLALLRKSDDPAVREMGLALTAIAIGGSTLAPGALDSIESLVGDANYGRFLSQVGTTVAAGLGNAVLLRTAYTPEQAEAKVLAGRRRMVNTLVVMTMLFCRDRPLAAELQLPSERLYDPLTATYWLVFSQFMVRSVGGVAYLAHRTSRLTQEESLSGGLRCATAGAVLLASFYGQLAAGLAGRLVSHRLPPPLRGVPAQAVIGTGAAAIAIGVSLPCAVARLRTAKNYVQDARSCLRLGSMWRPFRREVPDATLPVGHLRSPDVRLFRRVIETLDGLDRLESRQDPGGRIREIAEDIGRQRGLTAEDITALERAALVRYANLCRQDDLDGRDIPATAADGAAPTIHADYRKEAPRLIRAGKYLRRSTLPYQVVGRVRELDHQGERIG